MAFVSLATATPEDWLNVIDREETMPYGDRVAAQLMVMLREQREDECFGLPVNNYEHCLQTATRAVQAAASPEVVVCSLFHDAAQKLAPYTHGPVMADILGPFVSEANEWMLRHHSLFQQHYQARPNLNRDARHAFRDSPHFAYTSEFCESLDQTAFDPGFRNLPLEYFEPIVAAYFKRFNSLDKLRIDAEEWRAQPATASA